MLRRSFFTEYSKSIIGNLLFPLLGLAMTIAASDTRANEHYLRFGFGLDHPESTYFRDEYCIFEPGEAPLYGCGAGRDGFKPSRSKGNFGNVPVVEFGIGYPSGRTRWELLIEYRPAFSFSGEATYNYNNIDQIATAQNISSLAGMVAGYIDLKEASLINDGKAVPFIGAGFGIARNKMNDFQIEFPNTTTTVPGAENTNLVWMIAAGIGFKLDENETLELSWHYTDLGTLYTGRGNGRVNSNSSGNELAKLNQIPTFADLKGHGIRLSLRIKI